MCGGGYLVVLFLSEKLTLRFAIRLKFILNRHEFHKFLLNSGI